MLPLFKPIRKELNKKTLKLKPPISHIIRTKRTLDSLEAKNRTNIARRPAKAKLLDDKSLLSTAKPEKLTCVAVQNLNRHEGPR